MTTFLTKLPFQHTLFQLLRFGIIGGTATLIHFFTVILLVETEHLTPLTANFFAFFSGFIISFSGHYFWTFSTTSRTMQTALPRFLLIAIINFLGNQTLYFLLLKKLHIHYILALLMVLSISATLSYCLNRWWAFR